MCGVDSTDEACVSEESGLVAEEMGWRWFGGIWERYWGRWCG